MKGKAKLLSPLLLMAMLVSLLAGALTVVVSMPASLPAAEPAMAAGNPDDGLVFCVERGPLNLIPTSAHEGILDDTMPPSHLHAYGNQYISEGTYCMEADFILTIPPHALDGWPDGDCLGLECTGHFEGTMEVQNWGSVGSGYCCGVWDSNWWNYRLPLDGTITLSDSASCIIPDIILLVSGGCLYFDDYLDTTSVSLLPGSNLTLMDGFNLTFTGGTLASCPNLAIEDAGGIAPHDPVEVCDNFQVYAAVYNYGTATATNVTACIDIYGDASLIKDEDPCKDLGEIVPYRGQATAGFENVSWMLHCDESGDVLVLITAMCDEGSVNWTYLTLLQVDPVTPDLQVNLTQPGNVTGEPVFSTCQEFNVTFYITNNNVTEDINVTSIVIFYDDDVVEFVNLTGEEPPYELAKGGDYEKYNLTLHCKDSGFTTIRVIASGTGVDSEDLYEHSNSTWIYQEEKAHLVAEVVSPLGDLFSVCDDFPVLLYVSNIGEADAKQVWVTVNLTGNLTEAGNCTLGPVSIDGGEASLSLVCDELLHCNGTGDVVITVINLTGYDENTGLNVTNIDMGDPITVRQTPLKVNITYPEDCDDFWVTDEFVVEAWVNNTGYENVTNVQATIDFTPDGEAELVGTPKTVGLGTLEPGVPYPVSWLVRCISPGDLIITVTADGDDVYSVSNCTIVHQVGPELSVTVHAPPSVCYCEHFLVGANVTNWGNSSARCVNATISATNATVIGNETKPVDDRLYPGESEWVWWELHCDGHGTATITVTLSGYMDRDCTVPIPAELLQPGSDTVEQLPALVAEITPIDTVLPCDDFEVSAKILNHACHDVPSVYASIWIDGPASLVAGEEELLYLGTVPTDWPPGADIGYQWANWTLHCDAPGPVNITVIPFAIPADRCQHIDGEGGWFMLCDDLCLIPDNVTVCQAELVINITEVKPGTSIDPCQTFAVKATVENISGVPIYDVWATIDISSVGVPPGIATLAPGEVGAGTTHGEKYLGDFSPGTTEQVSWTLHCDCPGDTLITLSAEGWTEVPYYPGWRYVCVLNDTVIVHQSVNADLTMTLDAPEKTCLCDEFDVTATISNIGGVDAINVNATITLPAGIELVEQVPPQNETIVVGTIHGGESEDAVWTVHCNATGMAGITVDATGKDALSGANLTASDADCIEQFDCLYVLITEPDDGAIFSPCQNFTVTAEVCNCNATEILTDVNVTITLPPSITTDEPLTKTIDTICPGCCVDKSWTVHCTGTGIDQTISVLALWEDDVVCCDVDEIDVNQMVKGQAYLEATIYFPDNSDSFATCQDFHVKASVTNTGMATATDVTATIGVGIAVTGEVVGTGDGNKTEFTLDHHLVTPGSEKIYLNDTLTTAYTITYGSGAIVFDVAPGVGVVITADYIYAIPDDLEAHGLSLVGPSLTQDLGDIPSGVEVPVIWTLHCTEPGDVTITVIPAGIDESTGEAIPDANIEVPSNVTVHQLPLEVIIQTPQSSTTVSVGENFYVNAMVTNTGDKTIPNVVATIAIIPYPFAGGGSADVGWYDGWLYGNYTTTFKGDFGGDEYIPECDCGAGYSVGYWDGYIDGCWCGYLDGYFTGWIDGYYVEDYYVSDGYCDGVDGYFTGWHNGHFCGYVHGDFDGFKDGWFWGYIGEELLTKELGDIRPGETHDVTWTLQCTSPGDVMIFVVASVEGTDAQVESDRVIVHQQYPPELGVEILSPEDETLIATCQEFMVSAMIYNWGGAPATDVVVTIGYSEFVDYGNGMETMFWLDYECVTPGSETIFLNGVPQERDVDYTMGYLDGLIIFTTPPGSGVAITAQYLAGVSVVEPGQTQIIDEIPPLGYEVVNWTLHCDTTCCPGCEIGEVDIGVMAVWTDANTGDMEMDYDDVCIDQYPAAHLVVDITAPEDGSTITVEDDFYVTATVTNTGESDAWDVSLTLSVYPEGSVMLLKGGYTENVGHLAGHGQMGSATVSWYVECKEACSSTITVTAAGQDECGYYYGQVLDLPGDSDIGDAAFVLLQLMGLITEEWEIVPGAPIPDKFIEPDSITVKQVEPVEPAHLTVDLSCPEQVYAEEDFAVTAIVSNIGEEDAENVTVTLTVTGPATVDGGKTKTVTIDVIAGGDSKTVSWELECEDEGGINVAVSATGADLNTASDSGAVQQVTAPHAPHGYGGLIAAILGGLLGLGVIIAVAIWLARRKAA